MNGVQRQQWFQARLRWAVMEEDQGLTHWREEEHIFLSENRELAFQEALRIGYAEESSLIPNESDDLPVIDYRFAEVVYLEEQGCDRPFSRSTWERRRPPSGSTLIIYSLRKRESRSPYSDSPSL